MTTEQVKTTRKVYVTTEEGEKSEQEVSVNFSVDLPESLDDKLLQELLSNEDTAGRIMSGIKSYLLNAATMHAAREVAEGNEVTEVSLFDALKPTSGSRFSYKKAAQAQRDKAIELGSKLAAGEIDVAEFTAQHSECLAKAAEFEAKHEEQQSKRAKKTKKK